MYCSRFHREDNSVSRSFRTSATKSAHPTSRAPSASSPQPLSGRTPSTKVFARALRRIARRYHRARRIHLVLDNLSTHSERCVVLALGARAGRRLWRRLVVHYTPKHASWLNAAEMEGSLVSRECIGSRRIGHLHTLKS